MDMHERLKAIREDNDDDQGSVARILGTTQQQISKYENGQQKMSIDRYVILAKHYNISLDYLAGIIDSPRALIESKQSRSNELTPKQRKLLEAYSKHPDLQAAINKLLGI